ncbi:hypothetical protein FBY35_6435 [Streptomyces sp. SLBN-118]|uniref:hypothetical protein n=1 Tax=Streptomyces sp. SLBN-118 TaxID=2768454 RepID=UPI001151EFD0|nr:hypothetical protein [Streptomyces sp. SLBN-118]TQK44902.1 hypothetical protein FBY35_6435 [Streptomyces sp. SLBN-118]
MKNWQEDARFGYTNEPSEVTIQLDGRGRFLGDLPAGTSGSGGSVVQEGSDGPVFVDESGRRSKKFRRLGWVLAIACACYAVTLVVALVGGNSAAPLLPGLGTGEKEGTDKVEIQPAPSDSTSAQVPPGGVPGAPAPTDSTGALLPRPSGSASGGPGGLPAGPGPATSGSAVPQPSGKGVPVPGASASATPGGGGSAPGPEPDPSPSVSAPSDPGPSTNPTDPPVQEGAL